MAARDHGAVIAKLRRLLAKTGTRHFQRQPRPKRDRPASFSEAARELELPRSTLHDLAVRHGLPRRGVHTKSAEQRRTFEQHLRDAKLTVSKISRLVNIAKSTGSTWRQKMLDKQTRSEFRPTRLKRRRVCPKCGYAVEVWPCVACNCTSEKPA